MYILWCFGCIGIFVDCIWDKESFLFSQLVVALRKSCNLWAAGCPWILYINSWPITWERIQKLEAYWRWVLVLKWNLQVFMLLFVFFCLYCCSCSFCYCFCLYCCSFSFCYSLYLHCVIWCFLLWFMFMFLSVLNTYSNIICLYFVFLLCSITWTLICHLISICMYLLYESSLVFLFLFCFCWI